jgi:hypothetical protein
MTLPTGVCPKAADGVIKAQSAKVRRRMRFIVLVRDKFALAMLDRAIGPAGTLSRVQAAVFTTKSQSPPGGPRHAAS